MTRPESTYLVSEAASVGSFSQSFLHIATQRSHHGAREIYV